MDPSHKSHAILLLLLAAVSLCGMIDAAEYERVSSGDAFVYVVVVLLSLSKASLLLLAKRQTERMKTSLLRHSASVAFWLFLFGYALLCLTNVFCFAAYGFGISLRMMNVLLHTGVRESLEYLPIVADSVSGALPLVAAVCFVLVSIGIVVQVLLRKADALLLTIARVGLYLSTLLCLLMYFACYETGRNSVSVFLRTAKSLIQVRAANVRAAELLSRPVVIPFAETIECHHRIDNLVLVIGESADRRHCSAYGYPLPTNRHTMQYTDSLLWFTNAKAPFCGTDESLARLLTFMDDSPESDISRWNEYPDVVSVMQHAGYRCYWISNQQRLGNYVDCTTVIGGLCDGQVWLQDYDYDALLAAHDEALLPYVRQALSDSCHGRFVVVHLMGAHPEYRKRYPKHAAVFSYSDTKALANKACSRSEWQRIAEYDNAMLYSDSIVAQILQTLFAQGGSNVLVYLSDHGQNVYDTSHHYGHDSRHIDVPLMMYLSTQWRCANPLLAAALADSTDKPVATARLIRTVLQIADVKYMPGK